MMGLSPRVRGNRCRIARPAEPTRSIPACAGEPRNAPESSRVRQVYPRVCGGTTLTMKVSRKRTGLSPRVRGNPGGRHTGRKYKRSIPACAGEPPKGLCPAKLSPVYPRVCGGTRARPADRKPQIGLSPRVRGNPAGDEADDLCPRSIPACAGEPRVVNSTVITGPVYPRVCGGTGPIAVSNTAYRGLSPRVRGNLGLAAQQAARNRSIPACAGEPRPNGLPPSSDGVYPRVCGGTTTSSPDGGADGGLSPRVRGNLNQVHGDLSDVGSIPACAGEPRRLPQRDDHDEVYPRVCGGTIGAVRRLRNLMGLSPRVRGNQRVGDYLRQLGGSIPACAGEPAAARSWRSQPRVYPRVCGGTRRRRVSTIRKRGLSPRVRGNQTALIAESTGYGSIPACAGEPHCALATETTGRVYPRVCGGTTPGIPLYRCQRGLSPRVRGNLLQRLTFGFRNRSIPACAGEPPCGRRWDMSEKVYPRVCGGTWPNFALLSLMSGLSPRVRGNR